MARRAVLIVALAGVALWVSYEVPAASEKPELSLSALVKAASKYVAQYEQDFAFLIADEAYVQTRTIGSDLIQTRNLQSELFLTFLPADNEWVAVRDVIAVDGHPVMGHNELQTLLSKRGELRGLIAQVVDRNARYNIGITRNFNEPTLPLLLVDAKRVNDVKFERKAVFKDGDATLATLEFAERGRPTLVRGPSGSMPAKGEIVIEAGTGVVRRTRFELDREGVKVRLTTDYTKDRRLGLWLPSVFMERYDSLDQHQELVTCHATYSNYRRFEVVARIK